jgi:hypothetical protein
MKRLNDAHCVDTDAWEGKFNRSKEVQILKNGLFNVLIIIALLLVVSLAAREAFATADVVSEAYDIDEISVEACAHGMTLSHQP